MKTILLVFSLLLSSATLACDAHSSYPDAWWKAVPNSELKPWEIAPQAADRSKNEVILSKRNELGMLSNFFAASFEFQGRRFASIEGFWQAMKYPENRHDARNSNQVSWPHTRSQVEQMTAFDAKQAGEIANQNMKKLGISWVSFNGQRLEYKGRDQQAHYDLIFAATQAKVLQNPEIKNLLLRTKGLKLLPDHHQEVNALPAYRYGEIAMKIRDALPD